MTAQNIGGRTSCRLFQTVTWEPSSRWWQAAASSQPYWPASSRDAAGQAALLLPASLWRQQTEKPERSQHLQYHKHWTKLGSAKRVPAVEIIFTIRTDMQEEKYELGSWCLLCRDGSVTHNASICCEIPVGTVYFASLSLFSAALQFLCSG